MATRKHEDAEGIEGGDHGHVSKGGEQGRHLHDAGRDLFLSSSFFQFDTQGVIRLFKKFSILTAILVVALAILAVPSFASAATWSRLGGDPLFSGGIKGTGEQARMNFVSDEASARGQQAMRLAGLSSAEIKAVVSNMQQGKFVSCQLVAGMHFVAMSYGTSPMLVDDHGVTYNPAPGYPKSAPAFCLTVVASVGDRVYVIHILVPLACANFSIESIASHVIKKVVKHHPVTTTAEVTIRKIAEDSSDQAIPMPTGIFRFRVTAKGYKPRNVTLVRTPQAIGRYKVGTSVHIAELKPLGSVAWVLDNPKQQQKVVKHGNTFTFKNVEKPTATPAGVCNDVNASNHGAVGPCLYVTNPCQGFNITGEQNVDNQCVVTICGSTIIINGTNYGSINVNVTCGPTPTPTCASEDTATQQYFGTYPNCYTLDLVPNQNQEFYTNTQGNYVCAASTGSGSFVSVQVIPKYENTSDGGKAQLVNYNGEELWCDTTYSVGNDLPPVITPPAYTQLPSGNYDPVQFIGTDANGNQVTVTDYVNIVPANTSYPT